jgi:integrase
MRVGASTDDVDGGLELPLKVVQARLGHASVTMTTDRYGHLFPHGDDGSELAAAEKLFYCASRQTLANNGH